MNRVLTARSSSVVLQLVSAEGGKGGATGFRLYYRIVEGSPLDICK